MMISMAVRPPRPTLALLLFLVFLISPFRVDAACWVYLDNGLERPQGADSFFIPVQYGTPGMMVLDALDIHGDAEVEEAIGAGRISASARTSSHGPLRLSSRSLIDPADFYRLISYLPDTATDRVYLPWSAIPELLEDSYVVECLLPTRAGQIMVPRRFGPQPAAFDPDDYEPLTAYLARIGMPMTTLVDRRRSVEASLLLIRGDALRANVLTPPSWLSQTILAYLGPAFAGTVIRSYARTDQWRRLPVWDLLAGLFETPRAATPPVPIAAVPALLLPPLAGPPRFPAGPVTLAAVALAARGGRGHGAVPPGDALERMRAALRAPPVRGLPLLDQPKLPPGGHGGWP